MTIYPNKYFFRICYGNEAPHECLRKLTSQLYPRRNKMEVGANATKETNILL